MENTSNYGLKRWDGGDRILHTEFNDNWDKIDTAIKDSEDKAAAALAAATALEQKMGLQHIQTVNGTTGDCSIFTYSIDWDQWTEVLFFLTPKLSGSNLTYQLSFENRAMTSDGSVYFSGTLGGDSSFVVYPFSSKNTSLMGLIFRQGTPFPILVPIRSWGDRLVLSPNGSGTTVNAGTTLTINGRK
ncbi:MAG: hypothetical protein ACLUS6_05335 [Dysosmobacter sp.]